MQAILWPIISWLLREVIVKFVVFSAIFALVAFLVPYAIGYLGDFISPGGFTGAFSGLSSGLWWFLDLFRVDYGLPLAISAYIARFLIRRLPVIG